MRYGFFRSRGLCEFLDENGGGLRFSILKGGAELDRFFPNIGQPDPHPPANPLHKDDPRFSGDLKLLNASFHPFHAKYILADNLFEWIESGDAILLRADLKRETVFRRAGPQGGGFFTRGIEFDKPLRGKLLGAVSGTAPGFDDLKSAFARARRLLPATTAARTAAAASVFFNLMTHRSLKSTFYVPVNRTWTDFLGEIFGIPGAEREPQIFGWDTSFASLILAEFDGELARANLLSVLDGIRPDGRIAQIRIGPHYSNRTNPPVWFLAARRLAEGDGGRQFAEAVFDRLAANYAWFKRYRMLPGGTFAWGTDGEDTDTPVKMTGKTGAVFESGLDDSPLFDEMTLKDGRLDYACIDLSSLVYRAAEVLAELAEMTGRDGREYGDDLKLYGEAIRGFFDFEAGIANSFREDDRGGKRFARELTPASFYPLLTGLAGKSEVRLLETLFDSRHFRGRLPSLSPGSASFTGDGDYWRGRVWPPMVWLAAKGFERHSPAVYRRIGRWAEGLIAREWKRYGHVHENYSFTTGRGEPKRGTYARSCPLYSWGGLLGIL